MEKLEKAKHNHKLTDIVKVMIFALILVLPFLVFLPTGLYYGFNEHAQIEIPQKVGIYQTNEVNNVNDLKENNIYYYDNTFENNNNTINTTLSMFVYKADNIAFDTTTIISYDLYNYASSDTPFEFFFENDTINWKSQGLYIPLEYLYIENFDFTFVCNDIQQFIIDYNLDIGDILQSTYQKYEITETTTISENLSNSWENMWNTELFSWTKNSPFKTSINGFLGVFNIPNTSGLGLYLEYLITMVGIYVVFDIVIQLFKWLTHIIGEK